jgi:hypothetical protein
LGASQRCREQCRHESRTPHRPLLGCCSCGRASTRASPAAMRRKLVARN